MPSDCRADAAVWYRPWDGPRILGCPGNVWVWCLCGNQGPLKKFLIFWSAKHVLKKCVLSRLTDRPMLRWGIFWVARLLAVLCRGSVSGSSPLPSLEVAVPAGPAGLAVAPSLSPSPHGTITITAQGSHSRPSLLEHPYAHPPSAPTCVRAALPQQTLTCEAEFMLKKKK